MPVTELGGLERAKQLLAAYARGEPVGSEVVGFDQIAEDAKRQDPRRGEIVERGLREIGGLMSRPGAIRDKAREILASLD